MLKNLPSLKAKQLVRLLKSGGCKFCREGKGDHKLYVRHIEGKKRLAPIDMGEEGVLAPVCIADIPSIWIQ
ncbi:MAG: type II toxin-antitoxin system HicA family toxin [Desulfobacteraceae bacterium]|nr:type II toxin-antitoxin system HicA family toxin [Desulfobacteraceae bacterium]